MDRLLRNIRHAFRALRRSPGFALVAVLTLALGLGATTAIFTVLDAVVLRPLPYPHANRLVKIASSVSGATAPGDWGVSTGGYFYYRKNNHTLSDIGAYEGMSANVLGTDGTQRVPAVGVTASVLHVLGLHTEIGRLITSEDDRPGAPLVVMLSHAYWTNHFAGDPHVVGEMITIDAQPMTIAGVLAPGENLPEAGFEPDVWLPFRWDPTAAAVNDHEYSAVGRLKEGATVASAEADLERLTQRFPEDLPSAYSSGFMRNYHFAAHVQRLRDAELGNTGQVLWVLLGSVGVVLLIACANVANLFLVRGESRRRDAAVRTALGASRTDIARHYVAESVLVAVIAGAAAIVLAYWGTRLLLAISPSNLPRLSEIHLGWSSVAFTVVVAVLAGVVFGLIPSFRGSTDLSALRDTSRGMTHSRRQISARGTLVVAQIALAVVLLAGAGLLVRTFQNLRHVQPGFDPQGVLTVAVSLPYARYQNNDDVSRFFHTLETRVAALPGVQSVGATQAVPLANAAPCALVFAEDKPLPKGEAAPCLPRPIVAPGYFETMGIPVRGSVPQWTDVEHHTAGVVVSQALAERIWPGEDAIGKGINGGGAPPYYRVVGVAGNVHAAGLEKPPTEAVYYPMTSIAGRGDLWSHNTMVLVVRTGMAQPAQLTGAIRRTVTDLDRNVPIANVQTMDRVMGISMAGLSFNMLLIGIAALLALTLSVVGLYGVISYVVGQRTGEIAIRMALGAPQQRVLALVLRQGMTLVVIGVTIGVIAALGVTRLIASQLYGVRPTDPTTFAGTVVILAAVALAATLLPAVRATRVDPAAVLKSE
ncbi:MAG TPA: ABC transporter permease [Gemmatimonadaceae bacterium]|nr:ABC transporter permease [Gemmatimonadaceae bacterium]